MPARGWLEVLTQQSCECLSPSGRLYGYSFKISEIAKGFLFFNIVPQIAQMNTDFPTTIYYPQMRPVRSDDYLLCRRLSFVLLNNKTNLFLQHPPRLLPLQEQIDFAKKSSIIFFIHAFFSDFLGNTSSSEGHNFISKCQ